MAVVAVRVTPRAPRERLLWDGATLSAWVTAPPVEGAANAALEALLARALDLPRGAVRVAVGARSRRKLVEVDLDATELLLRLERYRT